ncbi:hypothetical protein [Nocardia sp. NBC_01329]|uniref:hypothetical protein n=1 Tax=Nocardia sp. NBC_01329 TaxID=2903594 RepID=UPI002E119D30|nr:hypothetical protein OG405_07140 [Nocardia sp. NBC_01329]
MLTVQAPQRSSSFVTGDSNRLNRCTAAAARPEHHAAGSVPPLPEEMSLREEAEQLRKPSASLAVAGVMGLLIIVLLLASHGKQDDGDRRSRPIEKTSTSQQQ